MRTSAIQRLILVSDIGHTPAAAFTNCARFGRRRGRL